MSDPSTTESDTEMQACFEEFGFQPDAFGSIVRNFGGFIAGSAALRGFCNERGVAVDFAPGDVDVWIPTSIVPETTAEERTRLCTALRPMLSRFMEPHGFHCNSSYYAADPYYPDMNTTQMVQIMRFHSKTGKKIQFIVLENTTPEAFVECFDISIAQVLWTPDEGFARTAPEVILQVDKKEFRVNPRDIKPSRITKYQSYGFELQV